MAGNIVETDRQTSALLSEFCTHQDNGGTGKPVIQGAKVHMHLWNFISDHESHIKVCISRVSVERGSIVYSKDLLHSFIFAHTLKLGEIFKVGREVK